jgi:hypothetical protein
MLTMHGKASMKNSVRFGLDQKNIWSCWVRRAKLLVDLAAPGLALILGGELFTIVCSN